MDVVHFHVTGSYILSVVHFYAQIGKVVAFPAYSFVCINNLVVVILIHV